MSNKKVESHRDLVVWQKCHDLVQQIFRTTEKFSKKEQNLLGKRLRDAAIVVPTNIAIGFEKRSLKLKIEAYREALTQITRIQYMLELADALGETKSSHALIEEWDKVYKMLKGLIRANSSSSSASGS